MVESGIGLVRMYQDICGYLSSQNFPESHEQQTVAAQDVDSFFITQLSITQNMSTVAQKIILFMHYEGEENLFQQKLKEAIWVPHLFRISVAQHEYMNEKRQRITARAVVPVDFAAESRLSKMKTSQ
ncbi:hypothetical protein AAG906_040446 [Vitis piasezkii]